MLLKDLRKAIWEGKLVDITGVKLRSWGTDHQLPAVLHISFDIPSVENKPISDSLDITEVNLSTKPKYDPCRKLRKGDIVEVRIRDERIPWGTLVSGSRIKLDENRRYVVLMDENRNDVRIEPITNLTEIAHTNITVDACYLELVTPVEELEPYRVETGGYNRWSIKKGDLLHSQYPFGEHCAFNMNEARAAAEAECKRLNEKYRKEQE